MELDQLHFLRPWFLALLGPLVLVIYLYWKQLAHENPWKKVCEPHLLQNLMANSIWPSEFWKMPILLLIIFLLLLTALAGPTWQKLTVPLYKNPARLVIALDLSPLMLAQDLKPDRITRAQFKIQDLLKQFDGQTGLIAFADESYVVSPLTTDNNTLNNFISELSPNLMPVQGSNIKEALKKAASLFGSASSNGDILLITANSANSEDQTYAQLLARQGIHVSVLAMATNTGAPVPLGNGSWLGNTQGDPIISKLDSHTLATLAQNGKGQYVEFSGDNRDINNIILMLKEHNILNNQLYSHLSAQAWLDEGHWLILLLLPFLLIFYKYEI